MQPLDHRRRQLDTAHTQPALLQRDRDPSGSDGQLQNRTLPGQLSQYVDRRPQHPWREHLCRLLVVSLRVRFTPQVTAGHAAQPTAATRTRQADFGPILLAVQPELRDLWDFNDPQESERRFRAAASDAAQPELALSQVARAVGLQRRFDEAADLLAHLDRSDPEVDVRVDLENGRIARDTDRTEAAHRYFGTAADKAERAGLQEPLIDALHMLALVSDQPARDELHQRALATARTANDPAARRWEASLLNNIGMDHADAGNFDAALPHFEAALAARRALDPDPERVLVARWMVAWALRNLGRSDEALDIQRQLKAELTQRNQQDAYVDEEIALLEAD